MPRVALWPRTEDEEAEDLAAALALSLRSSDSRAPLPGEDLPLLMSSTAPGWRALSHPVRTSVIFSGFYILFI